MRVLAIDPGFERLGIAVLEKENGGPEKLVYSECITTSPEDPFSSRIALIGSKVVDTIKTHAPDVLAIETLFFNTNQKTAMRVSEARGAVIFIAASRNMPVYEYTPLSIKTALTGYGRAEKRQVTEMVKRIVDFKKEGVVHDDEFDAIAVGLTHFAEKRL